MVVYKIVDILDRNIETSEFLADNRDSENFNGKFNTGVVLMVYHLVIV